MRILHKAVGLSSTTYKIFSIYLLYKEYKKTVQIFIMGKPEPILRQLFKIGENPFSVFLFQHQLAWCPQKKGGEDMSEWINVKLKDVLRAEIIHKMGPLKTESNCCFPFDSPNKKGGSYPFQVLEVTYAQETKSKDSDKWVDVRLELNHNDFNVLTQWAQTIQYFVAEFDRPKNLLFFVNPFGGKGKAVSIFTSHIQPILQLCQVKSTVIQTKRHNHVSDVLRAMSDDELMSFDAVVAVGGDGTICEVVNGMLKRKLDNVMMMESDLQPAPLPIAVIAAGSTNAVAYTIHGTDDPRTGMLHIVLGNPLPLDVASIHNDSDGIVRFIIGQMSYGYLADVMLRSENLRWMGPKRYKYAGFREFVNHATYKGSIDIKQSNEEIRKIPSQCSGGKGCSDCFNSIVDNSIMDTKSTSSSSSHQWKRIEGDFVGVSAANMSLRNPMTPLGIAPFAHFSDGFMELILIRKTSRLGHLRYLHRTTGDSKRTFALPFVERYRVREFVFTPTQCNNSDPKQIIALDEIPTKPQTCQCDFGQNKTHSAWNCDGELLFQPSVRVSAHSNLIQILTRSTKEAGTVRSSASSVGGDDSYECATISSSLSFTRSGATGEEEIDASCYKIEDSQ